MSSEIRLGVQNADVATDFLEQHPCTIGYSYIRVEVTGVVRPCCISRHATGSLQTHSFKEIWHSSRQNAFRQKMLRISEERFHITDPQWAYCQQCSHLTAIRGNAELAATPFKD